MLVSERTEVPILPLIELWILPGSIIYSECWKSYHNINKFDCCESPALLTYKHIHFDWLITNKIYNFLFTFVYLIGETMINYTHITVNHDQCYKDPVTGTHTNTVEGIYHGWKRHAIFWCCYWFALYTRHVAFFKASFFVTNRTKRHLSQHFHGKTNVVKRKGWIWYFMKTAAAMHKSGYNPSDTNGQSTKERHDILREEITTSRKKR
jgi:hypothetical protein